MPETNYKPSEGVVPPCEQSLWDVAKRLEEVLERIEAKLEELAEETVYN